MIQLLYIRNTYISAGIYIFLSIVLALAIFINLTPGYIQNNPCACGSMYITDSKRIEMRSRQCPRIMFECGPRKFTLIPLFTKLINAIDFNK